MKKKETPKPKKVTSHISEYSSAMEELEDKCASAVARLGGMVVLTEIRNQELKPSE